jgi:hypothetical protein
MGIHVDGYQDSGRLVHLPCRLLSPLVTGEQPLIRMGDRSGKQIARTDARPLLTIEISRRSQEKKR